MFALFAVMQNNKMSTIQDKKENGISLKYKVIFYAK